MLGPKSSNRIDGGDGNTQVGHNTGTVNVGLTFEQHEAAVERRLAEKVADLERAHGAEKQIIQAQAGELRAKLRNIEADYKERLVELADLKQKLARYENQIDRQKLDAAYAAIDRDDTTLAEALFKELLETAKARREDAERDEAMLEFELGKIAEAEVRWHDAAEHYARAARLEPSFENLLKAGQFLWRAGRHGEAIGHEERAAEIARRDFGSDDPRTAKALNNLAANYSAAGRFADAEPLLREALEVTRPRLGEAHPDYAACLNNLAGLLRETGRHAEAEPLYREALEVTRAALGEAHPQYAACLNNLAGLLRETGRHAEAEPLYREALEVTRAALGEAHPDYATRLNNLAGLLRETGRHGEAEPLYREALEVTRRALGEAHPDYANRLNNLAGLLAATGRRAEAEPLYEEALRLVEAALGPDHPHTKLVRGNLEVFRAGGAG